MITLKSKLVATLAVFLITSMVLSSYIALTAATPKVDHGKSDQAHKIYKTFTLEATGTAINKAGEKVNVELSIEGLANGKIRTVFHLRTQGGDAIITGYDTIYATKGQGIIVNKCDYIHLNVMMSTLYYGGRNTVWILRGTTGDLVQDKDPTTPDTLSVHLESRRVVLPLEGYPQLRCLKLNGEIAFK